MSKPKIVILRGSAASGKTTALYRLKKNKKFKDWAMIDNCFFKMQFKNLGTEKMKEYGHGALFYLLKEIMPTKRNIVIDEMSENHLRKHVNYYIKKYGYEVVVFQFVVSVETAIKREDFRKGTDGSGSRGAKWVRACHEMHRKKFDNNAILVDTDVLNEKQVEKFIVVELGL
jgi:predicted kinase